MGSIAHELITRGWVQTKYEDQHGAVCIRTAARYAHNCHGETMPQAVEDALAIACGEDGNCLPGLVFNDADGRTYDEVLRAAKLADEILDASCGS
jgi:hypothetical protein